MNILTVDFKSPEAPQQFAKSCRETGFAVLSNHDIPDTLMDQVYAEWAAFFAQSKEAKQRYLYDRQHSVQDGYFPDGEKAKGYDVYDIKEFYHFLPNGRTPEGVSEATRLMRASLLKMGTEMLTWLQQELPSEVVAQLSMPLDQMVDEGDNTLLRILHYPPLQGAYPEGAIRAAAHEDINLITLLVAATQPGLEVKNAQGDWFTVPCQKHNIVVNVGDMLQEATAFYLKSTTHRVVNPVGPEAQYSRYSIPVFIHARDEVRLSDRYTRLTYLEERLRELGLLEK